MVYASQPVEPRLRLLGFADGVGGDRSAGGDEVVVEGEGIHEEGLAALVNLGRELGQFGDDGSDAGARGAVGLVIEQAPGAGSGGGQRGVEDVVILSLELGPAGVHSLKAIGFGHELE